MSTTDALSQLGECSHLLNAVLKRVSWPALLAAESVSPGWREMINCHYESVWIREWETMRVSSKMWRTLSTRLKYHHRELFEGMEKGNAACYRQACHCVERHIQAANQFGVNLHNSVGKINFAHRDVTVLAVNEKYVYLNVPRDKMMVVNRWTGRLTKKFSYGHSVMHLALNDQFLAVSLSNGDIVVYNSANHSKIQTFSDINRRTTHCSGVCLGRDTLISYIESIEKTKLKVNLRRLNPSSGCFGPHKTHSISVDFEEAIWKVKAYLSDKYLILDMFLDACRREIRLYDLKSLEFVRKRSVIQGLAVQPAYNNGVIIMRYDSEDPGSYLATWNVEEDTITPLENLPPLSIKCNYVYSGTVTHQPDFHYVIRSFYDGSTTLDVVSSAEGQRGKSSEVQHVSKYLRPHFHFTEKTFYFDGVQCIFVGDGVHIINCI